MSNAHEHHYVPRMHLKRFAVSPNSRMLVVYDKERKTARDCGVKGQAYHRDLYTLNCGTAQENTAIEDDFLAKVDNYASLALDRLLAGALDQGGRETLSVYLASLVVGNPRMIEAQQQHDSRIDAEIYRRMYFYDSDFKAGVRQNFATDEEFVECWRAAAPEHVTVTANKEMTMSVGISIIERICKVVSTTAWTLLLSVGNDPFILGDRPVFSCKPGEQRRSPVGLLTTGQETTVPLSSRACLVLTVGASASFVSQEATHRQVCEINKRSAHASRRWFYASEVRQEWRDLMNCFDKWDEKTEFFDAPNIYVSLERVENHLFRPVLS